MWHTSHWPFHICFSSICYPKWECGILTFSCLIAWQMVSKFFKSLFYYLLYMTIQKKSIINCLLNVSSSYYWREICHILTSIKITSWSFFMLFLNYRVVFQMCFCTNLIPYICCCHLFKRCFCFICLGNFQATLNIPVRYIGQ